MVSSTATQAAHPLLADYPRATPRPELVELRSVAKNVKWHFKRATNRKEKAERELKANEKALAELDGISIPSQQVEDKDNKEGKADEVVPQERQKRDRDGDEEPSNGDVQKAEDATPGPAPAPAPKRSFVFGKAPAPTAGGSSSGPFPPNPFAAKSAAPAPPAAGGRPKFVFNAKGATGSSSGPSSHGFLSGGRGGQDAKAIAEQQEKIRQQRLAIEAEVKSKQTAEDRKRLEAFIAQNKEDLATATAALERCESVLELFGSVLTKENQQLEDDWAAAFNLKVVANGYPIYFLPKQHDDMTAMMVASQLDKLVDQYTKYKELCSKAKKAGEALILELVNITGKAPILLLGSANGEGAE